MFVNDIVVYLNDLAKNVPLVGNTLSLSIAGAVVAMFWKAPKWINNKFDNWCVVSLRLDNTGWGDAPRNYFNFLKWYQTVPKYKFSKSFGIENHTWEAKGEFGPTNGFHFFFYKGHFLWLNIQGLDSQGSEKEKRQIINNAFNKKILMTILEEFSYKEDDVKQIYTFRKVETGWNEVGPAPLRKLNTICINREKKAEIMKLIHDFLNNKQWYKDRGIPYKLTLVLYGPPGTAKTSLIKAIARELDRHIALINISNINNEGFEGAMYKAPKNAIIGIEDFDSCPGTLKREYQQTINKDNPDKKDKVNTLTLTTILNTLDGIKELDGQITFLTTNHLEKIDDAIFRPGRVDKCILIPALTHLEVKDYINLMYPGEKIFINPDISITGGQLQELVIENKFNFEGFKQSFNQYNQIVLKEEETV